MIIKLNQDYTASIITDIEPCDDGLVLTFEDEPYQRGTAAIVQNKQAVSASVRDGGCLIATDYLGECQIIYEDAVTHNLWRSEPIYIITHDGKRYAKAINRGRVIADLREELESTKQDLRRTQQDLSALIRRVSAIENHDLI